MAEPKPKKSIYLDELMDAKAEALQHYNRLIKQSKNQVNPKDFEPDPEQDQDVLKIKMIMGLRNKGISSPAILKAMETVPREMFLSRAFKNRAYEDRALPIECGQTISQPYIVAYMAEQLEITDRHKVLEIGTGSGYQAAILSKLVRRLYTVERYNQLNKLAEQRFAALNLYNITSLTADGLEGWPVQAPFDRIVVAAAAERIPMQLVEQLKDGGIMILPLGAMGGDQRLLKVMKQDNRIKCEELCPVRFVPLVKGVAQQL